ncbi:hypothetical protein SUDANB95_00093 [Actinosynnema sp. ALI-1.44]
MRAIALSLTGLALTACAATVEADPTFLVVDKDDSGYLVNVVSGRPSDLRADNWHQSRVDKSQFTAEVREGDHVICHLTEDDHVEITDCRPTDRA